MPRIDRRALIAFAAAAAIGGSAAAAPQVGQPAPAFQVKDMNGKVRSLAEFRGKTVVLEWTNNGCPYVLKHYNSGNMQTLQREAAKDGVVWLNVISSAPGFQGHLSAPQAKAWKTKSAPAAANVLLDADGKVGRLYDARTTPHMYVIDKGGKLVYMGGIDDKPYQDPESLKDAKNYVRAALADIKAGRPVATSVTRPYGCSVKYASAG